jgi:hypothetical protein
MVLPAEFVVRWCYFIPPALPFQSAAVEGPSTFYNAAFTVVMDGLTQFPIAKAIQR